MTYEDAEKAMPQGSLAQWGAIVGHHQAGWSWMGDDGEGSAEMCRDTHMGTTERIYITRQGLVRPNQWPRNKPPAPESQREVAESADEKRDGSAENAGVRVPLTGSEADRTGKVELP
jgi:hypothetical protein